jgi:hypothetical protein
MSGADSALQSVVPYLVRGDVYPWQIDIFEEDLQAPISGKALKRRDITGGYLKVTVSDPDTAPTSGTWNLSYDSSSANLSDLDFDITAAELETTMNNSATVSADGDVTVSGGNGVFIVRFNSLGSKSMFIMDDEALLYPASTVEITRTREGDSEQYEEQVIRLVRRPYAQSTDWTVTTDSATGSVTLLVAGSSSAYAVAEVILPPTAIGGSFRLSFGGVAERYKIVVGHATPADYQNLFWDAEDNAGPVRFWINYNAAGVAPTTPPGGRLIAIALAIGDNTTALIATAIRTAIAADSQFSGTYIFGPSTTVAVVNTSAGARTDPTVSTPLSGYLTFTVHVDGENGLIGEFQWNCTKAQLDDIFDDEWTITQTNPLQFRFVANELGAAATPTLTSNFTTPQYFEGVLALNETALYEALAELDVDTDPTISATLEMEYTGSDGYPETVLLLPVIIARDGSDSDSISPNPIGTNINGTVFSASGLLARLNLAVLQ